MKVMKKTKTKILATMMASLVLSILAVPAVSARSMSTVEIINDLGEVDIIEGGQLSRSHRLRRD
ncbi:MAG: hypothetical protein QMC78_03415 [Methanocellales archaeon]|nr:hypothetical protein [Methanocellales archaeon]